MHAAASAPSQTVSDAERAHIVGILKETNWVVGGRDGATARLGLPRTTLISRMQKLGISNNTGRFHLASVEAAAVAPPQNAPLSLAS
jgi:transcriptional regulator with GAF, ATPase, and Fis domain